MRINNVHCFDCGQLAGWICDICRNVICYDCINLVVNQEVCDGCRSVAIDSAKAAIQDRISKAVDQALKDASRRFQIKLEQKCINLSRKSNNHIIDAIQGISTVEEPRSDQVYNG